MENNLFLIGIKCNLEQLANYVFIKKEKGIERMVYSYSNFWGNITFIWYNQDTHLYTVKEILNNEVKYFYFEKEKELFRHMDDNGIKFIYGDNPLGEIFQSYSAAYLALIRWAADVAWTKHKYDRLVEEYYE